MPLNNQQLSHQTTIYDLLQALKDTINYNMNCVKVATVLEFDPELMTVKCRVNNKRLKQLKQDGNQVLENYPDIYAKAHFFGWGDVGSVYPIEPGMEGLLLFNDRELETWFMTSEPGKLAYDRNHDLTDALFICGLHSQPKIPLLPYLEACLHIYYKNSDIQIRDTSITTNTTDNTLNCTNNTINTTNHNINSTTNTIISTTTNITSLVNIIGNTTIEGNTISTVLEDATAATGQIIDSEGKVLADVVKGIVRRIY